MIIHDEMIYDRKKILDKVDFLTGNSQKVLEMRDLSTMGLFNEGIKSYLSDLSKILMKDPRSKMYPDVMSFAFWIRTASLKHLEEKYGYSDHNIRYGRGVAFHVAPSNVPVNFAYSLAAGLITGNANIVRIPSKNFPQIGIIVDGINASLKHHATINSYITLIRYERNKEVNDFFSSIADIRIIWGGDNTISEVRKSPLHPRSIELTFADRYSLAVIDSDAYLDIEDKSKVAQDFYNDTYFSDQNACTSPRLVVWTGNKKKEAKKFFWSELHEVVKNKYVFQDIQGVNKLVSAYKTAAKYRGIKFLPHDDNLVIRVSVGKVSDKLMDQMDNSGFFFECDCDDPLNLKELCNNKRCQTIGYIGNKRWFEPLLRSGIKGIDRIVPIGHTMDFDLVWDGYDLICQMTRAVTVW